MPIYLLIYLNGTIGARFQMEIIFYQMFTKFQPYSLKTLSCSMDIKIANNFYIKPKWTHLISSRAYREHSKLDEN